MTDLTQYIKVKRVIDGIKTVKDLEGAYFAFWKFRRDRPYDRGMRARPKKDMLKEKLLLKMREVL
jgi:hypothetical protein